MSTSTIPMKHPSFYAQNFSTLAMQNAQAHQAAQNAAHQQAAVKQAAKQAAHAQRVAQIRNFAGSFTTAPSFVSVAPPATLSTPPPQTICTTHPTRKVQPEKSWSFETTNSFDSNMSNDAEEELILHPNIARASSQRISSQNKYEADAASILKGAFGDTMVTGKPPVVQQDSSSAMRQRAALIQNVPATALRSLLQNRVGTQKIFLMRHGESEGNVSRYDVLDPKLTQIGLMQAKSWQEVIGEFGVELVLVSPLRRTLQTALLAFSNEQVPFVLCRSAREFGWGCRENTISLEQRSMADLLCDLPHGDEIQGIHEALYPGLNDPMDEYESLDRLKLVLASRPENLIMVVCHYGVINALTGNRSKNGDVYECTWGGDDELKVTARHRNPLSDQTCICG